MRKPFVTVIAIASLAVLLGLTMILASVVSRELTARMDDLKARSIEELQTLLGHKVSYAGISPSFLSYLEVRDLVIHSPDETQRPLLVIHRVRIYYSLIHLLFRRDPIGSLREIQILNTRFSLDLQRDQEVIDLLQRLTQAGAGEGGLRARITGANVGISFHTEDASVTFSDLFFQIDAGRDALAVALRGSCRGTFSSGFAFSSTVGVEGKVDRQFTWSDLTMRLLAFDSSLLSVQRQTVQVVWKGKEIEVHKIQDRSPIDLGMKADLERQEITVNVQAEGLRPDRLIRFAGALSRFNGWLSAPMTAAGQLTYSLRDRRLAYEGGITASFADQLPVRNVTLETTFRGTEKEAFFFPLRVGTPGGSIQFDGSFHLDELYPEGLLTLVNMDTGTGHRVSANLTIQRQNGRLSFEGRHLTIGEVGLDAFSLALSPAEKGTAFAFSASFAGLPSSSVSASGELRLGQTLSDVVVGHGSSPHAPPALTLSASLQNVPPDRLYHLLLGAGPLTHEESDLKSRLAPFSLSASFDLATDLSAVTVHNGHVSLVQSADPSTAVTFDLAMDSSGLSVSGFSGNWKGYSVQGALHAALAESGEVSFASDFKLQGTPYSLSGRYSSALGLFATGTYGFEASVIPNHDGSFSMRAKGRRMPVPIQGNAVTLSFDVSGLYSSSTEWMIRAPTFIVYDVPFLESRNNTLELSGRLTPSRLALDRVIFTDSYSTLSGSAEALLSLPPDLFSPDVVTQASVRFRAALGAAGATERYDMRGSLSGGNLSASLDFTRVPLGRLRAFSLHGSLSGTGTLEGPVTNPAVNLTMTLNEGRLGTDPLAASAHVSLGPGLLTISAVKLDYLAHHLSNGAGTVNVREGSYDLTGAYAGEYFSDHVRLTARLQGQFNPNASRATADGLLDQGLQGKLSLSDIYVQDQAFAPWAIAFRTDKGRLTVDGGPGNGIHGSIDSHLAFAFHLASPLPIIGDAGGRIVGDRIDASVTIVTADLTVLNSVLKSPQIPTTSGTASVLTFASGSASGRLLFSGPFNDPDFNGELAVIGGGIRSAYFTDEIGPITTRLIFDGKGFHSLRVPVTSGATRLTAQATFTLDHWAPLAFDLNFTTLDNTTAHMKVRFGRMIADGRVMGTMRIAGDDAKTNVTGDIQVTDCRITLGQSEVSKFVPEEVPTFLTLNAETGKRVEFAWPSENYPVIRTTASPGGKVTVTYRGDTGAYTVKGDAGVQGGEVYYFERSFIMKKGTIAFNEDQSNFDPRITARAELREWDPSSGEEMRIFLDADSPLSKFTPRFSSDPPRSDNYIMAMIGAPFVARAESQGLGISAALMSSDVISQTWVLRPLEQRLRDILKLDMVSVRTQIIQNLLVQKLFGTTLNPLDNTSVSLGKYIGNDLFLEMLVRLQSPTVPVYTGPAGLPPSPVPTLPSAGIGLVPQLELNMEWATPFFLLDWSFQPQHPETMFLTDQSLSFNWRFSY